MPERLLNNPPIYYGNFLAMWLGVFQSPQALEFGQFWYDWPGGWRYRWVDQEFWPAALWLLGSSGKVVDGKSWRSTGFAHCADGYTASYTCRHGATKPSEAERNAAMLRVRNARNALGSNLSALHESNPDPSLNPNLSSYS